MRKPWLSRKKLLIAFGAIAIVVLLVMFSRPGYTIQKARENVLHQDLRSMRNAIDQYTLDKNRAPQSLEDLVSANYLKEIPKDPITGSNQTWQVVQEDKSMAVDQKEPGINDVHSGSHEKARNGTTYHTW